MQGNLKQIVGILFVWFPVVAFAAEPGSGLPELTPEQLERYQFETEDGPEAIVEDLNVGQRALLDSQRREAKDILSRELGILSFDGTRNDLATLQKLYDRKVIRRDDVKAWQNVGVLFGDILVRELGLHWVSYEDELGVSKALQWRETRNFVFPITVFSKRLQFDERIDVQAIYNKIESDVEAFKAYEARLGRPATQ